MNLLTFRNIQKNYGAIEALRDVTLEVAEGSVLALLGPNGAGKSTLFGCLLGTILLNKGQILYRGESVSPKLRRSFGFLPERVSLYPQRTIVENVDYFAGLKGVEMRTARDSLQRFELADLLDRKVGCLSKGQLQRLGLAIALAGKPDLLVLDEPFNGLDPVLLEVLLSIIREEQDRGATILISTHTISAAECIATDVTILLEGEVALTGSIGAIRADFPNLSLEAIYHQLAKHRAAKIEKRVTI
jgi:ABC-type multidrug transport system ATPase subunit